MGDVDEMLELARSYSRRIDEAALADGRLQYELDEMNREIRNGWRRFMVEAGLDPADASVAKAFVLGMLNTLKCAMFAHPHVVDTAGQLIFMVDNGMEDPGWASEIDTARSKIEKKYPTHNQERDTDG